MKDDDISFVEHYHRRPESQRRRPHKMMTALAAITGKLGLKFEKDLGASRLFLQVYSCALASACKEKQIG